MLQFTLITSQSKTTAGVFLLLRLLLVFVLSAVFPLVFRYGSSLFIIPKVTTNRTACLSEDLMAAYRSKLNTFLVWQELSITTKNLWRFNRNIRKA